MKKNILYIISRLSNLVPVNILYGIISNLDIQNYNVYILTLHKEDNKNSRYNDFKKIVKHIYLNDISDFKLLLGIDEIIKKTNQIIKEKEINIIHTHCIMSTVLASNIKKTKKIATIHCDIVADFYFRFGILSIIYANMYRYFLNKMDLLISCGNSVEKSNYKNLKLHSYSIMNGIDLNKINLKNVSKSKEEIKNMFKIKNKKKIFVTVNSLNKRKNVIFLIKVFKKLKNEILLIIGDGEDREKIEKLSSFHENIFYLGKKNLKEVQQILKMSDYYISSSKSEGIPNSVLEALQFELPVSLSDILAHRAILEKNREVGILFENNNIKDCIVKINSIQNKKIHYSEFVKIKPIISAKRMSQEYMKFY